MTDAGTRATGYIQGRTIVLDLVCVGKDTHGQDIYLHRPVAERFLAMEAAALAEAGIVLRKNSAFRGMASQQREWDLREAALKLGKKYKLVARPGWSTHQSGCSIDLNRAHDDYTDDGVANGETDRWLQANAARFGFYNDVKSEPWHWTHLATVALLNQAKPQ